MDQNTDIGSVLSTLFGDAGRNAQAASLAQQDKTIEKRNAYQMGVDKALKQVGESHAMEAIQQGVPPEHIAQQVSPKQDNAQLLSSLIAMAASANAAPVQAQAFSKTTTPVSSQSSANPFQTDMTQIQKQANALVSPNAGRSIGGNIVNTLGNLLGINPMNAAMDSVRLNNLKTGQEILGQKPFQIGEYQKEILDNTYKLQQSKMIQPGELMTKFEQASQPFITQRDAFSRIESLSSDPSPAGDLGLIFSYMKLLDPPSTVREGEQATAENARGVPEYIRNLHNKIATGQKLTPGQRQDFYNKAGKIFKSAELQQRKTTDEFSKIGRKNGIDPSVFIRDVGLSQESNANSYNPKEVNVGRFKVRIK